MYIANLRSFDGLGQPRPPQPARATRRVAQATQQPAASSTPAAQCNPVVVLDRFATGDYRLRPHHYPLLDQFMTALNGLGQQLQSGALVVRITGHTYNSGSPAIHTGLSFSRVLEVAQFLESMTGVSSQHTAAGATQPVASNATVAGRARNRRVELALCPGP
jgi:outer membrane protein OmpA-like peptidoglycan-associated protein